MMRYQTLGPDCHPLSSGGRKAILRACKEDDAAAADSNGRIGNYNSPSSFEAKPLRARSAAGSASITPENPCFPRFPSEPENTSTASQPHHDASGGGSVLPQWGHRKRPRGSRAPPDDSPAGRAVKIRRASAAFSRGANLRPCTPVRDATSALVSRSEERSAGNPWPDKRSPTSPPEKVHKLPNGVLDKTMHPEPKPTERETAIAAASGSGAAVEKVNLDQFEWPRIYISLSRKEKEDDFLAMKGTKLPQRPKKRAKNVDKTLQYCFPGMWLSDLTRGRYEVREKKSARKKRRGLKGMENMDSDSD